MHREGRTDMCVPVGLEALLYVGSEPTGQQHLVGIRENAKARPVQVIPPPDASTQFLD